MPRDHAPTAAFQRVGDAVLDVPGNPVQEARYHAVQGHSKLASLHASLDSPARELDPSPFHAAMIHVALGEHDDALELLWEAFRQRTWQTALLGVEPMVDPLRTNPRFQALLEAMGMHRSPPAVTPIARQR